LQGGEALKKLAMAARKDIEEFLQKEVFLDVSQSQQCLNCAQFC
jgi:GTPase Era involved in 16S rRNA processing